jgi:hypothetical protein
MMLVNRADHADLGRSELDQSFACFKMAYLRDEDNLETMINNVLDP